MPAINFSGSLKSSPLLKDKQSDEAYAKGDHQEMSIKSSTPLHTTEGTNANPISEKEAVVGVVESLGNDNVTFDTAACSEPNISETKNSEVKSNAEMKTSGSKDCSAPSDSEPTHAKPMSTQCYLSESTNPSMVRGVNDGAMRKLATIERKKKDSTSLGTAEPSGDLRNGLGGKNMDDNYNSCPKELVTQKSDVDKREHSADVLRDVNNDEIGTLIAHPVPHDGRPKKNGLRLLDNTKMVTDKKSAGIRLPSLAASKGVSRSSNQGHEKLKGNISIMSTVLQSNAGQVNRLPSVRIDKIMPTLPSLRISRNITPKKQSSSVIVQDPDTPIGNLEKSPRLQVKSRMISPLNVQKQTPSVSPLKRKLAEAADLHPSKRLSPSDSMKRKSKVSASEVEYEVQTQCILVEGSKGNAPAENPSPKFDFTLEKNMENLGFTLMESDANVENAEACAKELDDICSMLKKKHDEAKELLVRALVNNNNLLMLNHPICEEKIRKVQRFASRLMSRGQEAGV